MTRAQLQVSQKIIGDQTLEVCRTEDSQVPHLAPRQGFGDPYSVILFSLEWVLSCDVRLPF